MSSGFGSGNQLERRVTDLERKQRTVTATAGVIAKMGSFSLSTGAATSTTVSDSTVTASSVIMYVPSNSNAWTVDGALNGITPGAGSFAVAHQASSLARSYNYIVINAA